MCGALKNKNQMMCFTSLTLNTDIHLMYFEKRVLKSGTVCEI